jgi:hypothetical protein
LPFKFQQGIVVSPWKYGGQSSLDEKIENNESSASLKTKTK